MTELGDAILIIADKMGVASTEVFRIVAEAQATIATINIISVVLFMLLVCIGIYTIIKTKQFDKWDYDCMIIFKLLFISSYILGLIVFITIIHDSIIMILCPEYTAIMELFNSIGAMI